MRIVGLLVGLVIAIALVYGVYRVQRRLKGGETGGGAGGLVSAGIRKSRGERQQELDRFIADYRAQQSPALTRQYIDATQDHQLGVDVSRPTAAAPLAAPERLLYLLLKSTLPDHHVFPNARIADFVRDAPAALAAARVPFLVCTRAFEPVVAVLIGPDGAKSGTKAGAETGMEGGAEDPAADAVESLSQQIGLRCVRLDPRAPPRRDQMRNRVIGK